MNQSLALIEIPALAWREPEAFSLLTVALTAKEATRFIRKGYDTNHRRGVFIKMGKVARRSALAALVGTEALVLIRQDAELVELLTEEGRALRESSDTLCRLIHEPESGIAEAIAASRKLAQRLEGRPDADVLRLALDERIQVWLGCLQRGSGTIEVLLDTLCIEEEEAFHG